ncbi:hypothetical protein E5358_09735 [Palleniella muris]|uniref:Uncharacterized protein n=1 Tax=Palleniella muris TaxID=3038145 RepID=A0AC61QP65_9BACT|nr:hypothetical protein [Palleniella muris]TGX81567.1 hypothetical protein E5358_09735 [Palleniella muris]
MQLKYNKIIIFAVENFTKVCFMAVNAIAIGKVSIENIGKVRESWFEIHLNSNNAEREFEPQKVCGLQGLFSYHEEW